MAGPLPQFEVKLEAGDTRAALMEKKLRAEMSFRQVSEDYHVVWLNCRDQSKNILAELEELKSLNLNGKIAQPPAAGVGSNSEAYLDWLYASLERLQDRFGQFLQQLSQATHVEVKHAPLKNRKRVLEKAFYDYQGDYSRLVDICRGSGVAEDLAGVVRAMKWVSGHCHVVRFKNRFCDGRRDIMARGGYRDILVNLELAGGAGGFVFELQIHLRPLFAMKEEAHKVLDLARAVIEPTLLKLSLLDTQESHVQLVHKIKQLEQQVSGLIIEAAVQGQQGQGQLQGEEWKNKYEQLQQEYEQSRAQSQREGEQSQQKYSQLQQQYEQSQNICEQLKQESKLLQMSAKQRETEQMWQNFEQSQSQQTRARLEQELEQSQRKYALQEEAHEQLQRTISQLKADVNRRDAEIQALKQLATASKMPYGAYDPRYGYPYPGPVQSFEGEFDFPKAHYSEGGNTPRSGEWSGNGESQKSSNSAPSSNSSAPSTNTLPSTMNATKNTVVPGGANKKPARYNSGYGFSGAPASSPMAMHAAAAPYQPTNYGQSIMHPMGGQAPYNPQFESHRGYNHGQNWQ